ncbi:MAG: PhzF family phenazine biosynthesis protein [Piscinibacter sp.]|uniref:PhzF family phenazine biosynthesis protein n=1 Tax=Piscinibacter sp. TaxID=1903157 RepID=UPI002589AFBE|nr:PhzF family phenazine biosynthesis protein [Piscinibacter sp.]MCW5667759.1 PhzF family phenazine biosynthesis protein [Piscinibacter sp.]
MSLHRYHEIDVFTATPLKGNPLAVVHEADGLDDATLQAFARWTNFSETTFLLPPTEPQADYRVRIFTPDRELPFAGHPTLGSCHAWLAAGGRPKSADAVVQQCGVGLVRVRRDGTRLAFAAPKLLRGGAVDAATLASIARSLRIPADAIRAAQWVDNGPGWVAVLLGSRDELLALKPDFAALEPADIGVVAPCPPGHDAQFEVRAFIRGVGPTEDPVTGSLNASLGQWLIGAGLAPERYVAAQGTALGRAGRVHVERVDGQVWVGGDCVEVVAGQVAL